MSRVNSLSGDTPGESDSSEEGGSGREIEAFVERPGNKAQYNPLSSQETDDLSPKSAERGMNPDEHRREGAVASRPTATEICSSGPGIREFTERRRPSLSPRPEVPEYMFLSPRQYAAALEGGVGSEQVSKAAIARAPAPLAARAGVTV